MKAKLALRLMIVKFLLLSNTVIHCQQETTIKGVIIDTISGRPVEYVNVGIFEKGIGTVSNETGEFSLQIPDITFTDSLTFSRIGYFKTTIHLNSFRDQNPIKIFLEPKSEKLNEVIVDANRLKMHTKGNKSTSEKVVLGISSALSLGKETGTLIKLPDKEVFLKDFNFHVVYNRPDSAKFRLNIYSYDKDIGDNILNENVYFIIPGDTIGDFIIDLTGLGLIVKGDIFVSLEVLAVYSNGPDPNVRFDEFYYDRINISGTILGSRSLYREISLGEWQKIKSNFSPGFWLTVSY